MTASQHSLSTSAPRALQSRPRALRRILAASAVLAGVLPFALASSPASAAIVNSVSFKASVHTTYNHRTGGGALNDGSTTWAKGELQGTDYKCGEVATFLFELTTSGTATNRYSVETTLEYTGDSTGQSGVALMPLTEPEHLLVNGGPIPNQAGTGFTGTGPSGSDAGFKGAFTGMNTPAYVAGSPAPVITEVGALFTSGAKRRVTFTTADVPGASTTVVRSDARILCKAGSSPTGNLQASLLTVKVTAPTQENVSAGNQTVNFRGVGNLGGLTTPMIEVVKEVFQSPPTNTCPSEPTLDTTAQSLTVTTSPITVLYCYWVYNWAAATANNVTLTDDKAGHAPAQSLSLTFPASSQGTSNLVGGGQVATASMSQTFTDPGEYTNTATAAATNGGTATAGTATLSLRSGPVLVKKVVEGDATSDPTLCDSAEQSLDLLVQPGPVEVSYCYWLTNFAAVDALDVTLDDDEAVPGNPSPQVITLTNLTDSTDASDTDVLADDLAADATATGVWTTTLVSTADATYTNTAAATFTLVGTATPLTVDDTAVVTFTAPTPEITVEKVQVGGDPTAVGQVITYEIRITNSGDLALTDVVLTDPNAEIGLCSVSLTGLTLQPGATVTCSATHTVTQADVDAGKVDNVASVSAKNGATSVTDTSTTVSTPLTRTPALTVTKTENPPSTPTAVGDTVVYSIMVRNTGNVTLTEVDVTDANADTLDCSPTSLPTTLAPNESITCSAEQTVTQADVNAGKMTNTASAAGKDPTDAPVTGTSSVIENLITQNPELTVTKTKTSVGDPSQVDDLVEYEIVVENTGNVRITDVEVSDADADALDCSPTVLPTVLDPTDTITCTASITVTQADIDAGEVGNTAEATGKTPGNVTLTEPSNRVVSPITTDPELTITKSMTSSAPAAKGDIVVYDLVVTNTGNVTISGVVVTDPTAAIGVCTPSVPATLAPGASMTCTASQVVSQANVDAGVVTNTANVFGSAPSGPANGVTDTSNEVSNPLVRRPGILLTKTRTSTFTPDTVGQKVLYSLVATNTGNVTLTNVTISDDTATLTGCAPTNGSSLAPGATMTCTAEKSVTQADLDAGEVENTASVTSKDPTNTSITDDSDTVVTPLTQGPSLTVTKVESPDTAPDSAGDVVSYRVEVTNSGNVTLTDVLLIDDSAELFDCSPSNPDDLAPGQSITCSARQTVTLADMDAGEVVNVARASGKSPGSATADITDESPEVVNPLPQNPAIEVVKIESPDTTPSKVGDKVYYRVVATNVGNVTLTGVVVTDIGAVLSECLPTMPARLAPGAAVTCTATQTVTQQDVDAGEVANVASATATPPEGPAGSVTDDSNIVTNPLTRSPGVSITKTKTSTADGPDSGSTAVDGAGDTITYQVVVSNSGNVTLSNVQITDANAQRSSCDVTLPAALAPGDDITCTYVQTVTQAEVDAALATNQARVTTDTPPGGTDPVDLPSNVVETPIVRSPSIDIVKTDTTDPDPDGLGDVATYSLVATNTGNVTLSNVSIVDPGATVGGCTPAVPATLAPGATLTCTATKTVTQAHVDAGEVTNQASVKGTAPGGSTDGVTDDSNVVRHPLDRVPGLTTTKARSSAAPTTLGDVVTYTIQAANTGNVTLTGVVIVDSTATLGQCTPTAPATLAPGQTLTCTATQVVTQSTIDAGSIDNVASSKGTPPSGPETVDPSNEIVDPLVGTAELTLAKREDPDTSPTTVGNVITYVVEATNTGTLTLFGVTITDPGTQIGTCLPANGATLAPGASISCAVSQTVTQADVDAGKAVNTAQASARTPGSNGPDVTATSNTIENPLPRNPGLSVTKSRTSAVPTRANDTVTYTVVATNTGNVTMEGVEITDASATLTNCAPTMPATLAPAGILTCTATQTVTQADVNAGKVTNVAGVRGTPRGPGGQPIEGTTPPVETTIVPDPRLTIVKTETPDTTPSGVGAVVTYRLVATNSGNVNLTEVSITDNAATLSGCTPQMPAALAPGATLTCNASQTVVQMDVDAGRVLNVASVSGKPPTGSNVTAQSNEVVNPLVRNGSLTVTKSQTSTSVPDSIGDGVIYTVTARNTGNVTLASVTVTDPGASLTGCSPANPSTLVPGASITCIATRPVTQADLDAGKVLNTAAATGTPPQGPTNGVTGTSNQVVTPVTISPQLTVSKSRMGSGPYGLGSVIRYRISARNTGNVTLTGVRVSDDKADSISCSPTTPTSLSPGAEVVCTASLEVTAADVTAGSVVNVASASGTAPDGTTPNGTSVTDRSNSVETPVSNADPCPTTRGRAAAECPAKLVVTVDQTSPNPTKPGDPVTYGVVITNTGGETATKVVPEPNGFVIESCTPAAPATLAPGASMVCTGRHITTSADLASGRIDVSVSATGRSPSGNIQSTETPDVVTPIGNGGSGGNNSGGGNSGGGLLPTTGSSVAGTMLPWALAVLVVGLGLVGVTRLRRRRT